MKREKIRLLSFAMILVLAIIVITPLIVTAYEFHCDQIHGYICENQTSDGCDVSRNQRCLLKCIVGDFIDCDVPPI